MPWSMAASMGRIINGITAKPIHVGSHFLATFGNLEFLHASPANQVTRFITIPGMITDANICQRKTSPATFIAGNSLLSPVRSGFCKNAGDSN